MKTALLIVVCIGLFFLGSALTLKGKINRIQEGKVSAIEMIFDIAQ
jgi:hypothetical protein